MKRLFNGILSLAVCLGASTTLAAAEDLTFDVVAAFAPNGAPPSPSPSWNGYVHKALEALANGLEENGDRLADPTAYEIVTDPIKPLEMFYTDFNSWRGVAGPNPIYALPEWEPFQDETGNRIHFGVHIQVHGAPPVSLHDLSWQLDSNDGSNWFDQSGDFTQALYSPTRVGINYGADGVKGGGDDQVYDGGELGSLKVHELIYVGVGEGFAAFTGDGDNNQDSIADNVRDLLTTAGNTQFDLAAIYTLKRPGMMESLVANDSVTIQIPAGMGGDFNFDRDITSEDKDLLTAAIATGPYDILFDLNLDSALNFDDLEIMVHEIAQTSFGDANCDGVFESGDLIQILAAGAYEDPNIPAVWSTGDFNADGLFTTTDLIVALADGGYENGPLNPAAAVAAVPEPTALALALIGLTLVALRSRRR